MRVFRICLLLTAAGLAPLSANAQTQSQGSELARAEVRFSQMDEKLREVQGKLEELDYENRRLREALDRFQQDTNMRLTDLESKPAVAPAPSETPAAPAETPAAAATPTAKADQVLKLPQETPPGTKPKFSTPREQYDHAFRLLNQTQYDEAGKAFESFIGSYPTDPLIGNAYYWAGETYYVRQNFTQAADYFRQGYEVLPTGPKAGDNLLKLGMTLNKMQREKEACVVLKQVIAKFGSTSGSIKNKAEQERNRAGCQ